MPRDHGSSGHCRHLLLTADGGRPFSQAAVGLHRPRRDACHLADVAPFRAAAWTRRDGPMPPADRLRQLPCQQHLVDKVSFAAVITAQERVSWRVEARRRGGGGGDRPRCPWTRAQNAQPSRSFQNRISPFYASPVRHSPGERRHAAGRKLPVRRRCRMYET